MSLISAAARFLLAPHRNTVDWNISAFGGCMISLLCWRFTPEHFMKLEEYMMMPGAIAYDMKIYHSLLKEDVI